MSFPGQKNLSTLIKQVQLKEQLETPKANIMITEPTLTSRKNSQSIKFANFTSAQRTVPSSPMRAQTSRLSVQSNFRNQGRGSNRSHFDQKRFSVNDQQFQKEKKFNLNDYVILEDNYLDLVKIIKNYYQQINLLLKGFGSEELKEYLESLWDIDSSKKEAIDLLPILESVFEIIIKFYKQLDEENFILKRDSEMKISSNSQKDYLFLLQSQEAEIRTLTRENQQLKISIAVYQEKLKNSEMQVSLLANYAQKEMENIKDEFSFTLNELKQREQDVDVLKEELNRKQNEIQSLEERLISVVILEHKIQALGVKNIKDIEKNSFEYNQLIKEMDHSQREALRKEMQERDKKVSFFKGKINVLSQEKRKLETENKNRVQQMNDIIFEKEQLLQRKVEKLQTCEEKLALRNQAIYLMINQKDKYGVPSFHEDAHQDDKNQGKITSKFRKFTEKDKND